MSYARLKTQASQKSSTTSYMTSRSSAFGHENPPTPAPAHVIENVPIAPSIPVATAQQPVPWSSITVFLVLAAVVINGFVLFINWYTIDTKVLLQPGLSISTKLKNCDVSFSKSPTNTSYVTLRSWLFQAEQRDLARQRDEWPIEWSEDRKTLNIRLAIVHRFRYLLCSVHFYLDSDFTFSNLHIYFIPSESYVAVVARTPIQATHSIHISALHGILNLQTLIAPHVSLRLGDGRLKFHLSNATAVVGPNVGIQPQTTATNSSATNGRSFSSLINVKSRTASISVSSSSPVKVELPYRTAERSLIRSSGGTVRPLNTSFDESPIDAFLHPLPRNVSLELLFSILLQIETDDGAVYIDVAEQFPKVSSNADQFLPSGALPTWAGREHLMAPHLLPWSEARFDDIKPWLDFEPFSPWIIEILEQRTSFGAWRYLSSSAYLRGNNWFVLFSAGLLQPRQKKLHVHAMGVFCRSRKTLEFTPLIPDADIMESTTVTHDIQTLVSTHETGITQDMTNNAMNKVPRYRHFREPMSFIEAQQDEAFPLQKYLYWLENNKTQTLAGTFIGSTEDPLSCTQDILAQTFLVLWRALSTTRNEATMVVYRDGLTSREVRFDVKEDVVVQDLITWSDIWFFIAAIFVNVLFSGLLAFIGTSRVYQLCSSFLLEDFNRQAILCTASHRLDHEIAQGEETGWSLSVTRVYYPTSGFTLRWNHEPAVSYSRFAVRIRSVEGFFWKDARSASPLSNPRTRTKGDHKKHVGQAWKPPQAKASMAKDIYLYLPLSAAKAAQDVVVHQHQLFLPFKHPGKVQIDCQQFYQLHPNCKYRFQLQAINLQGRIVDQSIWSAEVHPSSGLMFVDLPLLVLRRFCPIRQSSLELFVRKHVSKAPLHVTRLELRNFVLEMFVDKGTVKTTTRRRLLRGTMKLRPSHIGLKRAMGSATFLPFSSGTFVNGSTINSTVVKKTNHFMAFQLLLSLTSTTMTSPKEDRRKTTQRILFHGNPDIFAGKGGGTLLQLRGDALQSVTLLRNRVSQTLLSVDLSDGTTGCRVAAGYVRLSDIYESPHGKGRSSAGPLEVYVRLDHVAFAGQWGRLAFVTNIPGIEEFERRPTTRTQVFPSVSLSEVFPTAANRSTVFSSLQSMLRYSFPSPLQIFPSFYSSSEPDVSALNPQIKQDLPYHYFSEEHPTTAALQKQNPAFAKNVTPSTIVYAPYNPEVFFTKDVAAAQYLEGTDMTISWVWASSTTSLASSSSSTSDNVGTKPDNIYLHLIDHKTNQYLAPIHLGQPIPNTDAYSWTTHTTFLPNESVRACYIALSVEPCSPNLPLEVTAASNTFIILRCLPLCEFELCYAAFCRTYKLEMEHLSDAKLLENGLVVFEASVKICPNLRPSVPFEPPTTLLHCPGQCVPSHTSKLVKLNEPMSQSLYLTTLNDNVEGPMSVYKAVNGRIKVVENCQIHRDPYWWLSSPDTMLLRFDLSCHSLLFQWWQYVTRTLWRRLQWLGICCPWRNTGNDVPYSETFQGRRNIEFRIIPMITHTVILAIQLAWFSSVPAMILFAYIQYDRLLTGYAEHSHFDVDSNFILDFVFNPTLWFVLSLRFPGAIVVLFTLSWLFCITLAVLISPIIREHHPKIRRVVQFAGSAIQWFTVLLTAWFLFMVILWLVLGALINSEAFLPYAVMSASVFFAVYTVSSSFSGAREIVARFIEENLELLLSVAMGHWFESMSPTRNSDSKDLTESQKLFQKSQRFYDKVREARYQLLQGLRLGYDRSISAMGGASLDLAGDNGLKFRHLQFSICTYTFQQVTVSPGNVFSFSKGKATGLEHETMLPPGTRFATVAEAERNANTINNLTHGFEVACLQDGVKYGPRFNYKVERYQEDGSQFTYGIIAVPRYPPASRLSKDIKVALLFTAFDKDADDYLNEVELTMWQAVLKKPEFDDWNVTLQYYSNAYGVKIDSEKGANLDCISLYYTLNSEDLDRDYQKMFPIVDEAQDIEDAADDASSCGFDLDAYGLESPAYSSDISDDEVDEQVEEESVVDEEGYSGYTPTEQYKLDQQLVGKLNAKLLEKIYDIVTQEQQEKRFNKGDFPDSFLATKIVLTQFSFLAPIFPKSAILGGHFRSDDDGVTRSSSGVLRASTPIGSAKFQRRGNAFGNTTYDTLTELLKYVALEAMQDFMEQFRVHHYQTFDPCAVQTSISDFFDNVITQRIQSKAHHILNIRLDIQKTDLQRSTLEFMQQHATPKTAFQVWGALRRYRLERDLELREKLADAAVSGPLQVQMQVSLIVQVLVEVKVLEPENIEKKFAETLTNEGHIRETVLWIPRRSECSQFLARLIESHVGHQASGLSTEDLADIAEHLVTNYLWFNAFLMLLQLMGLSIPDDEFPGGGVWIPYDKGPSSFSYSNTLDRPDEMININETLETSKERKNMSRIKHVFNQLSNSTGFLPVDLADEAILLLTDNCLNYAGVIGCLQHLNLGGVRKIGTEDMHSIFHPDAVSYDIEPSSDLKEDVLDWTQYHDNSWLTDELALTFSRLTVSSPGFMGKSQMIEFTREIEKMFNAVSSTLGASEPLQQRQTLPAIEWINGENAAFSDVVRTAGDTTLKESLVTFEMYHRSALKLGFCFSRDHSRLMWVLCSNTVFGAVRQFLTARQIANFTIRLYLQPLGRNGFPLSSTEGLEEAAAFQGCVNFMMFRRLLRRLDVGVSEKGARNIWDEFPKDPVEIVFDDPTTGTSVTKYLRIEMDPIGFDTAKGKTVQVEVLRKELPRFLCTGLWPEAVIVLLNLRLQLGISVVRIENVVKSFAWKYNRYGLLRLGDVPAVISEATVEGLTFAMLRGMLMKMRLRLPEQDVKRMFDLMDVNHDHTLNLRELLAGFEMLFQRFVPNQIIDAVGLSYIQQLYITAAVVGCLLALFSFIGFAFTAFMGLRSGVSAAVQSVIALVGAVGLQSGASESIERVQKRMKNKITIIVGEDLDRKMKEKQEVERHISMELAAEKKIIHDKKPLEIKYTLPLRFRPDPNDPKPCVTFHPGDEVFLAPVVLGGTTNLTWHINPRVPSRTGLVFNTTTGLISGVIPFPEAQNFKAIPIEQLLGNQGTAQSTERLMCQTYEATPLKQKGSLCRGSTQEYKEANGATPGAAAVARRVARRVGFQVRMSKKTFLVVAQNAAGNARCRITFQVVSHARDMGANAGLDTRRSFLKMPRLISDPINK